MRIETEPRERWLGGIGAIVALAALVCTFIWPQVLTGWLGAAALLQAIPMGALILLAMMQLIRGEWEAELRPVCEAGALLLPLAALAFVPVLIGIGTLYDWHALPEESTFHAAWLSPLPFALRTILWFAALAVIAWSQVGKQASQAASSIGLIVITIGGSLLFVDWLMSLDPEFHSSAFGAQLLELGLAAAYLALLLLRLLLGPRPARPGILGGLLLVFLLFWAYFQFLPYFITWSGNLPEGAAWYRLRTGGVWDAALWTIAALGGVPLFALLFDPVRKSPRWLAILAALALAGKALEFAWFAIPGRGWPAALGFLLALGGFACLSLAGLLAALREVRRRNRRGGEAAS